MRKSREETAATRERILEAASGELLRCGIAGTGLATLMEAAGLSQGGFYRHFESKEALVVEALAQSFAAFAAPFEAYTLRQQGRKSISAALEDYLSVPSRDCADSCPLVALGSELVRGSGDVRETAADGMRRLVDVIASQLDDLPAPQAKAEAWAILSAMFGAMTLARIVPDDKTSETILKQTRALLVDRVDQASSKASGVRRKSPRATAKSRGVG